MKTRRFSFALLLVMLLACVAMFASCNKGGNTGNGGGGDHVHQYVDSVIAPTCTEQGYTTHTCSCGDVYVDSYVAAAGKHDYKSEILSYPTLETEGKRKLTCKACNASVEEDIEAFSTSIPSITDVVYKALNGTKYTLDGTDSEITWVDEVNGAPQSSSPIALQIAEIVLDGTGDELKGHIKLEINGPEDAIAAINGVASIYVYINGDVVSAEITPPNDQPKSTYDFTVNAEIYKALAAEFGMDVDVLASGAFIANELEAYVPAFLGFVENMIAEMPTVSEDFIENVSELAALVGADFIVEEVEGTNTVYTIDIAALKEFLTLVDGKTISEIIDDVYGAGSSDALATFIYSVPHKTVGDVVDAAIALFENYYIDINNTYYLINLAMHAAGAPDGFDIADEINDRYDATVLDLIAEMNGVADKEAFKTAFEQQLESIVSLVLGSTIDDLYNMMYPAGNTDAEPFSFIEAIEGIIDMLDQAISLRAEFDENGVLVSAELYANLGAEFTVTVENNDGEIYIEADLSVDDTDYLDFTADIDMAGGLAEFELVAYGDRYLAYTETNLETGEPYEVRMANGFGELFALEGYLEWDEESVVASVIAYAYDDFAGDVYQAFDASVEYVNSAVQKTLFVEVNELLVQVGYMAGEDEGDPDMAALIINAYGSNVFAARAEWWEIVEEDAVVGYQIEGQIIVEDNPVLFAQAEIDVVNLAGGAYITIMGDVDPTENYDYGTIGSAMISLENTTDGKRITVSVYDQNDELTAEIVADVTAEITETESTITFDFEVTADGETVSGEYVISTSTVDGVTVIERSLTAGIDGAEDVSYTEKITVDADSILYEINATVDGEVVADAEFGVEVTADENAAEVVFSYDIVRFVIDSYAIGNGVTVTEYTDLVKGDGQFTFTVEYPAAQ